MAAALEATSRGRRWWLAPPWQQRKEAGEAVALWGSLLPRGSAAPTSALAQKEEREGCSEGAAALGAHLGRWRRERKEGPAAESHTDNARPVFLCLVNEMHVPKTGQACHPGHC